ncbi:MAG: hypothetical protein Q7R87_04660 [Nanoarchaeota archaeon]|nr:hypothetical protein [Nanoarchaeota archaeon]
MKLHRYNLMKNAEPMRFGPHETIHTWEFEWFYPVNGELRDEDHRIDHLKHLNKIGLCGLPKPKSTCLIANLFLGHEPLVVSKDKDKPLQRRGNDTVDRYLDLRTSGIEEVSRLVDFLKKHDEYHLFMSTTGLLDENKRPVPNIVTFSAHNPPKKSYSHTTHINLLFTGRSYQAGLEKVFRYLPFRRK